MEVFAWLCGSTALMMRCRCVLLVTIIPHVFGTHCMNKSIAVSRYGVASWQYLTEACLQLLIAHNSLFLCFCMTFAIFEVVSWSNKDQIWWRLWSWQDCKMNFPKCFHAQTRINLLTQVNVLKFEQLDLALIPNCCTKCTILLSYTILLMYDLF